MYWGDALCQYVVGCVAYVSHINVHNSIDTDFYHPGCEFKFKKMVPMQISQPNDHTDIPLIPKGSTRPMNKLLPKGSELIH